MKLGIKERLVLLNILPPEGSFITLKIIHKLKDNLSFSEEELKTFGIAEVGNQVVWDSSKEVEYGEVDFEIGEKATDLIVEALKKLDKEGKLTDNHFSLYEKFVEPGVQLEVVK